jgi:hypothetical protein
LTKFIFRFIIAFFKYVKYSYDDNHQYNTQIKEGCCGRVFKTLLAGIRSFPYCPDNPSPSLIQPIYSIITFRQQGGDEKIEKLTIKNRHQHLIILHILIYPKKEKKDEISGYSQLQRYCSFASAVCG